jgi:hypothetical protein
MKTAIKLTALAAALACGVAVTQAGQAQAQPQPQPQSSAVVTEQRPVGAFSAIELAGPWHVVIDAQGKPGLSLSGERKELDDIETVVRGDTLVVRSRERNGIHFHIGFGSRKDRDEPTVHITAASLKSLKMSGSGDAELNRMNGDAFSIVNSGSGDLRASGSVRRLSVSSGGSGDLDLRDLQPADVSLDMNGSGDVELARLTSTLSAQVRGSGDLNADGLRATRVEAHMHGSGDVHLAGTVATLNAELSGSGELDARRLNAGHAEVQVHGSGNAAVRVLDAGAKGAQGRLLLVDRSGARSRD